MTYKKPTQEQVIAWAREAGDCLKDKRGREEYFFDSYGIEQFAALAYEAGRRDENAACAELIPPQYFELRDRIRARREQ